MNSFSYKELDTNRKDFEEAYFECGDRNNRDPLFDEYLNFSRFWQNAFIQSDYIIMTGNFETVNLELLYRFSENINRHPLLWKIFRFIFAV